MLRHRFQSPILVKQGFGHFSKMVLHLPVESGDHHRVDSVAFERLLRVYFDCGNFRHGGQNTPQSLQDPVLGKGGGRGRRCLLRGQMPPDRVDFARKHGKRGFIAHQNVIKRFKPVGDAQGLHAGPVLHCMPDFPVHLHASVAPKRPTDRDGPPGPLVRSTQ